MIIFAIEKYQQVTRSIAPPYIFPCKLVESHIDSAITGRAQIVDLGRIYMMGQNKVNHFSKLINASILFFNTNRLSKWGMIKHKGAFTQKRRKFCVNRGDKLICFIQYIDFYVCVNAALDKYMIWELHLMINTIF